MKIVSMVIYILCLRRIDENKNTNWCGLDESEKGWKLPKALSRETFITVVKYLWFDFNFNWIKIEVASLYVKFYQNTRINRPNSSRFSTMRRARLEWEYQKKENGKTFPHKSWITDKKKRPKPNFINYLFIFISLLILRYQTAAECWEREQWTRNLFLYDNAIHYINGKKVVLWANDKGDLKEKRKKWIINRLYDNCEATFSSGPPRGTKSGKLLEQHLESHQRFILLSDKMWRWRWKNT